MAAKTKVVGTEDYRIEYTCTECGAKDHPLFFAHENPYPVIDCWKCHAGFKSEVAQNLQLKRGMFPAGERLAA